MKASELRIGNWYDHNGIPMQVTPNTIEVVWTAERTWCKPIPLSEEWLLKFGFDGPKEEAGKYYELKKHRVYLFNDSFEFEFNSHDDYRFNLWKSYKYVHQLQNLYFALTGEELTILN